MLTPVSSSQGKASCSITYTQLLPVMQMCIRMRGVSEWLALAATVLLCVLAGDPCSQGEASCSITYTQLLPVMQNEKCIKMAYPV